MPTAPVALFVINATARKRRSSTIYQLVEEYYPAFAAQMAAQGTLLPEYVQRKFEDYLKCGRLEHGFLRVRCECCHTEHLVAFSCKHRAIRGQYTDKELPVCSTQLGILSPDFPSRPILDDKNSEGSIRMSRGIH